MNYHQTPNISRTGGGNKVVDHSDLEGASPVGATSTTMILLYERRLDSKRSYGYFS